MSRWQPSFEKNIFVIGDIHGQYDRFLLFLNRILPLRSNKDSKDYLILLGDLCDRGPKSPEVIDACIELKKRYPDQFHVVRGNHDQMLLDISNRGYKGFDLETPSSFTTFMTNGGDLTAKQYFARKGVEIKNPRELTINRVISAIDPAHLDFIEKETQLYFELDNYIFCHAGLDPNKPMDQQDENDLMWDRSFYYTVKKIIAAGKELPWDKTIICGHNFDGPLINSKMMMIDCSAKDMLLCVELESMSAFAAIENNKRLVKYNLSETIIK